MKLINKSILIIYKTTTRPIHTGSFSKLPASSLKSLYIPTRGGLSSPDPENARFTTTLIVPTSIRYATPAFQCQCQSLINVVLQTKPTETE